VALYNPQQHHALASLSGGADPKVMILSVAALALWLLGYPDQAQEKSREAITLAQKLSHPHSLAWELCFTAELYQFHRNRPQAQAQAEATIRRRFNLNSGC
jgi:predicted ATPase